jgi:transposase-like protein
VRERRRKLSTDQIRDIIRRYEAGDTLAALARDHGVTSAAIHYQVSKRAVLRRDRPTCRNGHPRTPENTYTSPQGARDCRACKRERVRACLLRKAAA